MAKAGADKGTRKKDRRSLYTEGVIKDALLDEIARTPFGQTSISAVCRRAKITRPTFYLHFSNLTDVLDELVDDMAAEIGDAALDLCDECDSNAALAIRNSQPVDSCEKKPFCELVLEDDKYAPLFKDDYIASRVVERIVDDAESTAIESGMPAEDAKKLRLLNLFRMSGCMAAAKSYTRAGADWNEAMPVIDRFVATGFIDAFGESDE